MIFIIFKLNGFSTDESVRPLYVLLENSDAATHLTTFAYIPESRTLYYITAYRRKMVELEIEDCNIWKH